MHGTGWKLNSLGMSTGSLPLAWYKSTRSQCISRPRLTWSLPTTGMLFSAWQATTQALQPTHAVRSIDMPHLCCAVAEGDGGIERQRLTCSPCLFTLQLLVTLAGKPRLAVVVAQCAGADDLAVLHQLMFLGASQQVFLARLANLQPRGAPRIGGGAKRIRIEADRIVRAAADPAGVLSAISQVDSDRVVHVARHDPDRGIDRPDSDAQLDDRHV